MLPKELSKLVPKDHLMSENEWRNIGVQQSRGWQHYLIHDPGKQSITVVLLSFSQPFLYDRASISRATHTTISKANKLSTANDKLKLKTKNSPKILSSSLSQ
jgi:hypothetical protein